MKNAVAVIGGALALGLVYLAVKDQKAPAQTPQPPWGPGTGPGTVPIPNPEVPASGSKAALLARWPQARAVRVSSIPGLDQYTQAGFIATNNQTPIPVPGLTMTPLAQVLPLFSTIYALENGGASILPSFLLSIGLDPNIIPAAQEPLLLLSTVQLPGYTLYS